MNCLHPVWRRNGSNELVLTPCGGCVACKKKRAAAWAFRLEQEVKRSKGNIAAVVLTYDDAHLTYTDAGATLVVRDIQLYLKRLRKSAGKQHGKIRYFCSGEYGSGTSRPHYHLILLNAPSYDKIRSAWPLGFVWIDRYRGSSWLGYMLKYIADPTSKGKANGRFRCFQTHSAHLGSNYLTEASINWHLDDVPNRVYAPLPDGKKAPLHRYYKDKIYSAMEKKEIYDYWRIKAIDDMLAEYLEQEESATPYIRKKRELSNAVTAKNNARAAQKSKL